MTDQPAERVIERLGHLGDGVAAGPVYVTGALPGEVVTGTVLDGRIAQPKILVPSSDRVRPPCPHARLCGGCNLQHADDRFVAGWKADIVIAALDAHGIAAEVETVHTSLANTRRRATLAGRRTKKSALVGFHSRASDTIIDSPHCLLLTPAIMALRPALAELVTLGASRKGALAMTVTDGPAGIDLLVQGGKVLDTPLRARLAQFAARHGLARLSWDDALIAQHTAPVQHFGPAQVTPPPGAFLQATSDGEKQLTEAVLETVSSAKQVIDLFAGCGTFSLPVAASAAVHAVEAEAEMLTALDAGWRHAHGLKPVTTEPRDLFRRPVLADELARFDAAVIDPPRAGAEAQMHQIATSALSTVAMVSCNPQSFARDARILTDAGFVLDRLQVVDQFRWSPHAEISARMRR